MMFDLVVVIVNWNGEKFIRECLKTACRAKDNSKYSTKIVCVDNHSTDRSVEIISEFDEVDLIVLEENLGFAAANNIAFQRYEARYFLMLNPDTEVDDPLNFDIMLSYMEENHELGIAGCRLKNRDGTWQKSIGHHLTILSGIAEQTGFNSVAHRSRFFRWVGSKLSRIFKRNFSHFNQLAHQSTTALNVDFVWGAYMIVRREVQTRIGLLDEDFFLFGEESDYCFRAAKEGWKTQFVPVTSIIHLAGQSQQQNFAKIYYWHIAVYFLFFSKNTHRKLLPWRVVTLLIQSLELCLAALKRDYVRKLVHSQLLILSFQSETRLPEEARRRWELIKKH